MKKVVFLLLASFLVLGACGNKEDSKEKDNKQATSSSKDDKGSNYSETPDKTSKSNNEYKDSNGKEATKTNEDNTSDNNANSKSENNTTNDTKQVQSNNSNVNTGSKQSQSNQQNNKNTLNQSNLQASSQNNQQSTPPQNNNTTGQKKQAPAGMSQDEFDHLPTLHDESQVSGNKDGTVNNNRQSSNKTYAQGLDEYTDNQGVHGGYSIDEPKKQQNVDTQQNKRLNYDE